MERERSIIIMALFISLLVFALWVAESDAFFLTTRSRIQTASIHRLTLSGSGDNEPVIDDFGDGDTGGNLQFRDVNCDKVEDSRAKSQSRRRLLISASLLMPLSQLNDNEANAACLPGDIREDCIGVYKLPMDDAAASYVETPEKLQKYAPDLKWVEPIQYPSNYQNAINQLKEQRQNFDVAQENIAKGDIKQGGLILLDVVPKVTAAGRYIVRSYSIAANNERNKASDSDEAKALDMKSYRIEYALNECLGYLGESDVLIGQGLRGELGVSAPAQLAILEQLRDARKEFDEFLRVVPENF
mmetsp:Transcript_1722/g.2391  ORF Transcript_1722/g.2391 Transcript_1722/m.2391 type:complete len:301 (+) Transcript_1722:150-1052(+)